MRGGGDSGRRSEKTFVGRENAFLFFSGALIDIS